MHANGYVEMDLNQFISNGKVKASDHGAGASSSPISPSSTSIPSSFSSVCCSHITKSKPQSKHFLYFFYIQFNISFISFTLWPRVLSCSFLLNTVILSKLNWLCKLRPDIKRNTSIKKRLIEQRITDIGQI